MEIYSSWLCRKWPRQQDLDWKIAVSSFSSGRWGCPRELQVSGPEVCGASLKPQCYPPRGRVTAQSRTGGSNRSICYCLSETCPTKCLVSRLNAPGASRASTPTPLPVPDTLLLGEGYDDTLNMQEGMRGNTATGQIIWRRNLFPGRLPTAGFLALACCHANETKINIPRSAKPCVNNHTANNLNKIPCPVPK